MAFRLTLNGEAHDLTITTIRPRIGIAVDGYERAVVDHGIAADTHAIEVDGKRHAFIQARDGNRVFLRANGRTLCVDLIDPRDAAEEEGRSADDIRAPMPGVVIEVMRADGETVQRGETILTIESMKLQTNITAPRDGVIARVGKAVGHSFDKDEVIVSLATQDGE